ncbi:GNAT family N-acetyltransferase [Vibrio sp.]|uniref:GNAT family N-acetyltransferase n=1 Tax=Vibrio sp. TaxID=678 RepID=UPI003D0AAA6F
MQVTASLIQLADTSDLLRFELENKQWFDRHIPPRLNSFYSLTGVQSQIEEFLELYEQETMIPMLLRTSDGQICGRLNLHIDESEPSVGILGYRVGQAFTRQGVATRAVKLMQQYVVSNTDITALKAIALTTNLGSIKVLENNGFEAQAYLRNYTMLNGHHEHAHEYLWRVPSN